jgi:RimJ/RimL family protein N-acetyltransferase
MRIANKVRTLLRLVRNEPRRLIPILVGGVDVYIVHSAPIAEVPSPPARDDVEFRPVSVEDLAQLAERRPEARHLFETAQELGSSAAFGVHVDGRLASICWMITPELERNRYLRLVGLRAGEIEIGRAYTFPEFRGRGLCALLIQAICAVAREEGAKRVFMITARDNEASRRCIEKAGPRRSGYIVWVRPPLIGTIISPILRTYRFFHRAS